MMWQHQTCIKTNWLNLTISAIDAGVAAVVAALNANTDSSNRKMYDNTYIIFTSDNGGANDAGASTWPLRGGKGSYYEGGKL